MELIERLENLKSTRKQFGNSAELFSFINENVNFKNEIVSLSKHFLHRTVGVGGCSNCVYDAYFELITLKNYTMSKYKLRSGALLRDINGDSSKMLSNANMTDELAEYHLRTNPKCIKFFEIMPPITEVVAVEDPINVETTEEVEPQPQAQAQPQQRKKRK